MENDSRSSLGMRPEDGEAVLETLELGVRVTEREIFRGYTQNILKLTRKMIVAGTDVSG